MSELLDRLAAKPVRPASFVALQGDAAEAAIRQGIPCDEAIGRAVFAIEAHYQTAGLPTALDDLLDQKETPHEQDA